VTRTAQLCIHKDELSFSAGHFTIFSATEREQLHGHNYYVSVAFTVAISNNGLSFDYRHYKKILLKLCDQLDRHFLLPANSPFLNFEEDEQYYYGIYNSKKIPFLKEDVVILPITNTTIEELSHWFLEKLMTNKAELDTHSISEITLSVFNGPGQSASATWKK
jgi:6-pyruvoyltetrahydropterin/6-carboxytetrahydropterin synthase